MTIFKYLPSRFRRPGMSCIHSSLAFLMAVLMTNAMCGAQTAALSQDARRDLELRPGVVLVYIGLIGTVGNYQCKAGWSGTGFLYRPDGYLITNGHVAQMANMKDPDALRAQRLEIAECVKEDLPKKRPDLYITDAVVWEIASHMRVESTITIVLDNGAHYDGEIKAYSDPITDGGKDVAIIKIDANNLPTVPLGNSDDVNVDDHVYVIGYPGKANISKASMLVATSSDGIISAVKNKDYSGTPLLQTNANINHGNSGGPAFDAAGRVIGIATFGKDVPGYNFLVPISTAKEFVRQAGAEPERGSFDKTWHDALDAYSNGEWSKAHSLLKDVLEMMPNQPEAEKLQLQAAAKERTENPIERVEETIGLPAIVGIVALLVATGGLLIWLLVRTPKPAKPTAPSRPEPRTSSAPVTPLPATSVIEVLPRQTPAPDQSFGVLHVSGGPLGGNRFPIPKAGLMIGRDPAKCTVVLSDDSVSKEHAWVVPLDNGVAIIDRNSANGTYVNSVDSPRINKVVLRHGDRVFLGRKNGTVFTYYSA
jgi:serine protease Do